MMYHYGYGSGMGWGGGFGILEVLWNVFWAIVLVVALVWLLRLVFGRRHGRCHWHRYLDGTSSALEILNERFAKGEIGKEEYEERRRVLLAEPENT